MDIPIARLGPNGELALGLDALWVITKAMGEVTVEAGSPLTKVAEKPEHITEMAGAVVRPQYRHNPMQGQATALPMPFGGFKEVSARETTKSIYGRQKRQRLWEWLGEVLPRRFRRDRGPIRWRSWLLLPVDPW